MVRPSKDLWTRALTVAQSDLAGDGTTSGENVDIDGGGTGAPGSGVVTPPVADALEVVDDSGAAVEIDFSLANWWDITLTADCTLTIVNPPASGTVGQLHIILRQGTGAPWTVTWPAEVIWPNDDGTPGGPAPALFTVETAGDLILLTTEDGGTTYDGNTYSTATSAAVINAIDVLFDNSAGGTYTNVQEELAEILDGIWGVTSVGSLTAGGSPQTVVDDTTWNEFPGLVRLDPSRVLTVYRGNGTDHITDGQICGQIGTLNDAHTAVSSWSTKFTILDDTDDLRCEDAVSIIVDSDGVRKIVVAYRHYDGTNNVSPRLIICDDLPEDFTASSTWSSPVTIPLTTGSAQNYTQGHVHKVGSTFVLGVGWQSAGTHSVGIATWTASLSDPSAAVFTTIGSGATDYAEIAFNAMPDGVTYRAHMRTASGTLHYQSSSTSLTSGWSGPASFITAEGYPMWRILLSGQGLTVYRHSPNGDNGWRREPNSTDASWGSETILDATGTRSAYATLLQISPTAILCLYAIEYSAGGTTGTADIFAQWFTDSSTFGISVLTSPMTTEGDLIYQHTGAATRLGIGAAHRLLHSDGTDPAWAQADESDILLSDVTTLNVSTTKHGFAPKSPNDATVYLDGTGNYSTPAGGSGSTDHQHIMNLWFSGDGATTVFTLPAGAYDSNSIRVWVSGTLTDVTLSGTILDTMTFAVAPASATNNIVVDLVAAVA